MPSIPSTEDLTRYAAAADAAPKCSRGQIIHGAPVEVRLWGRLRVMESGCWEFQGVRSSDGYGHIRAPGTRSQQNAHRVAWKLAIGPLDRTQYVLHRCDNPPCCNPAHLFVGSQRDNALDRESKGRRKPARGERSGQAKLTDAQVVDIRQQMAGGAKRSAVAEAFGIHKETVSRIALGLHRPDAGSIRLGAAA